jgi:hypothetical protein
MWTIPADVVRRKVMERIRHMTKGNVGQVEIPQVVPEDGTCFVEGWFETIGPLVDWRHIFTGTPTPAKTFWYTCRLNLNLEIIDEDYGPVT